MFDIHRILHPTDFSDSSMRALGLARSLARENGATLFLVASVVPASSILKTAAGFCGIGADFEMADREICRLAAEILDVPVQCQTLFGTPGQIIIDVADQLDVDLIVMGTRGRTGIRRLFFGSTTEYVARRANCPVLMLKRGAMPGLTDESICRIDVFNPNSLCIHE